MLLQVAQLKAKLTEERAVGEARLAQQSVQHTKKLAEERAEVWWQAPNVEKGQGVLCTLESDARKKGKGKTKMLVEFRVSSLISCTRSKTAQPRP